MSSKFMVSHEKIVSYILGKSSASEREEIKQLYDRTDHWKRFVEILDKQKTETAVDEKALASHTTLRPGSEVEDLLTEVLSENTDAETTTAFLAEIVRSPHFYYKFLNLLQDLEEDLNSTEIAETVPAMGKEAFLATIYEHGGKPIPPRKASPTLEAEWQQARKPAARPSRIPISTRAVGLWAWLRPVGIGFAAVLMLFGGWRSVKYYQTDYKLGQISDRLAENYQVYYKDTPRPSGGYRSRVILTTLDAASDTLPYQERSLNEAKKVLNHDPTSVKAKKLLAQIYIITEKYETADSLLQQIESEGSADILNDLGVVNFHQQEWQQAETYFKKAITAAQFEEAYYNLALTLEKQGRLEEALQTINNYLDSDININADWRNAALDLQQKLQQRL